MLFSPLLKLKPGEILFEAHRALEMPTPNGSYALLGFSDVAVVDEEGEPVPPEDVFLHHLHLYLEDGKSEGLAHNNPLCKDGQKGAANQVLQAASEGKPAPASFPPGYGYLVPGDGRSFYAEVALMRTQGLAGERLRAAKECRECYYAEGKGSACTAKANGTLACCGQGSDPGEAFCPANSSGAARHLSVRLRYNVKYTRETWRVTPLQVGVLPAAPHCAEHFAVLRNASRENVRIASNYTMPFSASIKHTTAYLRAGAENISLYVNGQRRCASHARYSPLHNITHEGKNGTNSSKLAGGVLTHATHCVSPEGGPLSLRKGDSLLVEAWYFAGRHDKRLPWSDGTHLNAAAHFFLAFEPDAPISDIGSGEAVAEEDERGEAALLDAMGPL